MLTERYLFWTYPPSSVHPFTSCDGDGHDGDDDDDDDVDDVSQPMFRP